MEPRFFRTGDTARMKLNSTLIGVVVLALVATGVFWVRSRTATTVTVPAGQTVPAPASRSAPAPATVPPASSSDALPDVTLAVGTVDAGDVRISLSLFPQPPVAFAKTRVRVRAESGGSPAALEGGRVTFEMTMPMGDHRYSLVGGQDGWQEAEVILPRCMSGNRRWYATVEGIVAGRPRTARFRLDLASSE
jgi:hypothetical protein